MKISSFWNILPTKCPYTSPSSTSQAAPLETYHHTSTLDISHHPQGSYLVELHLPNGQVHRLKLIKE